VSIPPPFFFRGIWELKVKILYRRIILCVRPFLFLFCQHNNLYRFTMHYALCPIFYPQVYTVQSCFMMWCMCKEIIYSPLAYIKRFQEKLFANVNSFISILLVIVVAECLLTSCLWYLFVFLGFSHNIYVVEVAFPSGSFQKMLCVSSVCTTLVLTFPFIALLHLSLKCKFPFMPIFHFSLMNILFPL
jgi:hypothetical protein